MIKSQYVSDREAVCCVTKYLFEASVWLAPCLYFGPMGLECRFEEAAEI
jgi:hypothetical protein